MQARRVLRENRKARNISVIEIAKLLNISPSFYYKIEQGTRNPTIYLAKNIADILGKTVDELFFSECLDDSSNDSSPKAANE